MFVIFLRFSLNINLHVLMLFCPGDQVLLFDRMGLFEVKIGNDVIAEPELQNLSGNICNLNIRPGSACSLVSV
jgi:hypothetical protein